MNFPKYFPLIPLLEFDLGKYEVHDYEAPIVFGQVFVLKETLQLVKEYSEEQITVVSYLYNDNLRFRSL